MTESTQTDAEWIQTRAEKLKATLFLSWFNNYEQHIAAALTEAMERQREKSERCNCEDCVCHREHKERCQCCNDE